MTPEEQLQRWVAGEWVHRGDLDDPRSECTPDFGCCRPELQVTRAIRERFAAADREGRNELLGLFLGALLEGKAVYIAGLPPKVGD